MLLSAYHLVISWWRIGQTGFVDLPIFLSQARRFLETGELYIDSVDIVTYAPAAPVYKFPPLFAMLLLPFVRDGVDRGDLTFHWVAHLVLYLIAVGCAVGMFLGTRNLLLAALGLVLALNLEPFLETVWRLQVELPILLLLLAAFAGLRFRIPWLTGSALGVAAMFKIYPGFLLLYFLVRRRADIVMWAVLSAVLVTVSTVIVFGPEQNRLFFFEILPFLLSEPPLVDNTGNVSLARHLQELAGFGPAMAKTVQALLGLALLAVSALVVHRAGWQRDDRDGDTLGLCLFVALMLTAMPNSWTNYQLLLLPVLLVLLGGAWGLETRRGPLLAALFVAYLPLTFYQPCAPPTVSWPCAQTPFFLGLVQLPRGLHDVMVELRAISSPILWGCLLTLILSRRSRAATRR